MSSSALSAKFFHDEAAAYAKLESLLWPDGPVCPRCGCLDRITIVSGKTARMGLKRCGHCKRQFTVTVGTVFESSHVKLNLWLQASHMLCTSKKGMSSHQIHRTLGVTYRTAWFMTHRLREAMRSGEFVPFGGNGNIVEVDETFIGQKEDMPKRRAFAHKHAILSLVERGGTVRSFHVEGTSAAHLVPILRANIAKEASIMTDEAGQYAVLNKDFASHEYVNHGAGEYGRGEIHTNTLEGFYSIFKRGMKGVYQHCSEKHLHRYVAEFDFRYNNRMKLGIGDQDRAVKALAGIMGKRLKYEGRCAQVV